MTRSSKQSRRPTAIKASDPKIRVEETGIPPALPAENEGPIAAPPARIPDTTAVQRGIRWGGMLLTALAALAALLAGQWLSDLIEALFLRQDWLGWTGLGLLALAGFAATVLVLKEIWSLLRLRRLGLLREQAHGAINSNDRKQAESVAKDVDRLYSSRPDLAWGRSRLAEHDGDIMDARERLILVERELVRKIDTQASALIAATARRVSVLTAISPSSIVDMIAVAVLNLRMLRQVAGCYGARPGAVGLFRLARMVVTHIVLTGGMAIGDDLIQQLIGQKLTARLSARLGEGVFNGALTARIGIAAIDVCRPLPFIEAKRPRFRDLLSHLLK